jgi:hypothetical protein
MHAGAREMDEPAILQSEFTLIQLVLRARQSRFNHRTQRIQADLNAFRF